MDEIAKLKFVIKELAQLVSNNNKGLDYFSISNTGCGCCSDSTSYKEALEEEIAQPTYRFANCSALTIKTAWEILQEDDGNSAG